MLPFNPQPPAPLPGRRSPNPVAGALMAECSSVNRRAPRVECRRRHSESRSSNPHGPGRIPRRAGTCTRTCRARRDQNSKYTSIQSVGIPRVNCRWNNSEPRRSGTDKLGRQVSTGHPTEDMLGRKQAQCTAVGTGLWIVPAQEYPPVRGSRNNSSPGTNSGSKEGSRTRIFRRRLQICRISSRRPAGSRGLYGAERTSPGENVPLRQSHVSPGLNWRCRKQRRGPWWPRRSHGSSLR